MLGPIFPSQRPLPTRQVSAQPPHQPGPFGAARPAGFASTVDDLSEQRARAAQDDGKARTATATATATDAKANAAPHDNDAIQRERTGPHPAAAEARQPAWARPTVQEHKLKDVPPSDPSLPLPEEASTAGLTAAAADAPASGVRKPAWEAGPVDVAAWAALLPQPVVPKPDGPITPTRESNAVRAASTELPSVSDADPDTASTLLRKQIAEVADKLDRPGQGRHALPASTGPDEQAQGPASPPVVAAKPGFGDPLPIALDPTTASASQALRASSADSSKTISDDRYAATAAAASAGTSSAGAIADAAAPAGLLPSRLSAPPGSPDFAQQLGAALSVFVRQGVQHAKLEMNPAEMGPLTLQIRLDGDRAQVHMAAEHSQTRQALEHSMPQLAGSLREAGLTLTGGGVFEQPPRQPPLPADWEQQGQRARSQPAAELGDDRSGMAGIGGAEPISLSPLAARRGVVDLVA